MKIAVIGATGWIGSTVVKEALERGHHVIAVSRQALMLEHKNLKARELDLLANSGFAHALSGAEVVISAIGGRALGNHEIVANTAAALLHELPQIGIKRLIWVGGAGSLVLENGELLLSQPEFPKEYKDEAIAQGQALKVFQDSKSTLNWVFVSPAAQIFPGERTGFYRIGGEQLLVDNEGNSKISVQDYAKALIDEVEEAQYQYQRIGVAY
ncbi:hypothetical protein PSECIP111951_00352 [Pseudoalteromonas holothuriae]|uniref:NAD(P)-binding domain-containing protein n=1 Tax=Pseudoalteromonas holothuriae TaxID=2963714 RepID=A0A9W4VLH0_9GAMM|nr:MULTISPECIES: NAD(P)-dependent oxidoreductase [unclassified Pseudoalteromonas]CAH9049601.1 hypothetical protein PSECIP111854_00246 [Pseudoalteromonas sp. CIP111854]CAH9051245.1 hypothetical protein PSECIP111951_00352 [Pseudoalteromonas sp. CIP111951]